MGTVVFRERPFVSDGVWIAHECVPGFSELCGALPHNGGWLVKPGPLGVFQASFDARQDWDLGRQIELLIEFGAPCEPVWGDPVTAGGFEFPSKIVGRFEGERWDWLLSGDNETEFRVLSGWSKGRLRFATRTI